MRRRREAESMSLAFLDVITCGFGAMILLLVITKIGGTPTIEESPTPRTSSIRELQAQLFQIRGEVQELDRELNAKHEQLDVWTDRVAILRSRIERLRSELAARQKETSVNDIIEDELKVAIQELTEEMQRLLAERETRTDIVGGIPVDSEYIIFIIDSSGSMQQFSWNRVVQQLMVILDTYPNVQGLQIMNDEGRYMFPEFRGRWIKDNPARRRAIAATAANWSPYSNSSPVEGIAVAIRTFFSPDKKISLYVFGDDFSGRSVTRIVEAVERYNPPDENGKTQVRIHAIGFPALFNVVGYGAGNGGGGAKYATLMRELTRRNGGAFVGLPSSEPVL